jgi:hypothetical protein
MSTVRSWLATKTEGKGSEKEGNQYLRNSQRISTRIIVILISLKQNKKKTTHTHTHTHTQTYELTSIVCKALCWYVKERDEGLVLQSCR